jgi:hypothetical protein
MEFLADIQRVDIAIISFELAGVSMQHRQPACRAPLSG